MVLAGLAKARYRRTNAFFKSFLVARTSGRVYPEQNLKRKLISRSVCLQLLRNLAKITKNKIFNPNCLSKKIFRRRKMKRRESSETGFGKVSRQSELCLRGKRPFKVSKKFRNLRTRSILESLGKLTHPSVLLATRHSSLG